MPTQYRPYLINVYSLSKEASDLKGDAKDKHKEGAYLWPAKTLAQAKKQFLKEYPYFNSNKYQIIGAILKVKGWKLYMEKIGEKTPNAS